MYRPNCFWAAIMMAFGLGLLVGIWLEGGFFSHCFGFGIIICGWSIWKKR